MDRTVAIQSVNTELRYSYSSADISKQVDAPITLTCTFFSSRSHIKIKLLNFAQNKALMFYLHKKKNAQKNRNYRKLFILIIYKTHYHKQRTCAMEKVF